MPEKLSATRLEHRVALVSGGLRGIGLGVVERLLLEGATVVMGDLKAAEDSEVKSALERLGAKAEYLQLDVTQEASWQKAAAAIQGKHSRLDVLVNNAGVEGEGEVESISFESWRRTMSVNLDGVFLGTKTFTPLLAASGKDRRGGSSIVNMSSMLGMVGLAEASPYCATKGAVRLFTKSVAIEFAQKRKPIRVNSVHPGFVRTPLLMIGMERWASRGLAPNAQVLIDGLAQQTPIGRIAEPEEIGSVVAFLASDDSSYMTGTELVVDGGWTAQ